MPLNIPFLYESSFPYFDILRFENYEDDNILNDYEKSIYSSFKIEKRKKEIPPDPKAGCSLIN